MTDDVRAALLGDHEAAKRLTEQGVLLRCPFCGGEARMIGVGKWRYATCTECGVEGPIKMDVDEARLSWNTRTPILSAEELKKLEETK